MPTTDYPNYYEAINIPVPVGSRNLAGTFGGMPCPNRMDFGHTHGTAPCNANIEFEGNYFIPHGKKMTLTIGNATYTGIVVVAEKTENLYEGITSNIRLVDMRDRLHNNHVYGQFNMIEDDGRWFHIFPWDWKDQIKTIVRIVEKQDFNTDNDEPVLRDECDTQMLSAASILNELALSFNFTWSASNIADEILNQSRPENIDWNSGIKVIDAVQSLIEKNGLQFTCSGDLNLFITLKGQSDSGFVEQLINASGCDLPFFTSRTRGAELNERGRRVVLIGDRNKYEEIYPASPNWNPKFTMDMIFGWSLPAVLEKFNLTPFSLISDLPEEWHDPERWHDKWRNDMRIQDYVNEIVFRVYVVDGRFTVKNLQVDQLQIDGVNEQWLAARNQQSIAEGVGFNAIPSDYIGRTYFPTNEDAFDEGLNFFSPISQKMVSDTEHQFHVYGSYRMLRAKGSINPFEFGDPGDNLVTLNCGVSIDSEAVFNHTDCTEQYRTRLIFSDLRFKLLPNSDPAKKGFTESYGPDCIAIKLAVDKELYVYTKGENDNSPRMREQQHRVNSLRKNFVFGDEVELLSPYYREDSDFTQRVKADDVAERIATQLLFHHSLTFCGDAVFHREAGFTCDGIVDCVKVDMTTEGIQESITFTTLTNDPQFPVFSNNLTFRPGRLGFKTYEEFIAREANKNNTRVMRDWKNKQKIQANPGAAINQPGNKQASWIDRSNVFGSDNAVLVSVSANRINQEDGYNEGEGVWLNPPV